MSPAVYPVSTPRALSPEPAVRELQEEQCWYEERASRREGAYSRKLAEIRELWKRAKAEDAPALRALLASVRGGR